MTELKVEYAVGLHLCDEAISPVHVPVVRLEHVQAVLAEKDQELARIKAEQAYENQLACDTYTTMRNTLIQGIQERDALLNTLLCKEAKVLEEERR